MSIRAASAVLSVFLSVVLGSAASAQSPANLTRSEVAGLKAKVQAVQAAMGEPAGYTREDEDDFYLPTEASPAERGKFWPVSPSVQMRFTDAGVVSAQETAESAQAAFMQRYAAAIASGNAEVIEKMLLEMQQLQGAAVAAALAPTAKKEDISVSITLNGTGGATIDPDAVVLEQHGVIALREKDDAAGESGRVTIYLDPVTLADTEELSRIDLQGPEGGVGNKTAIVTAIIYLDGGLADLESWVADFDYDAILGVIDPR